MGAVNNGIDLFVVLDALISLQKLLHIHIVYVSLKKTCSIKNLTELKTALVLYCSVFFGCVFYPQEFLMTESVCVCVHRHIL